MARFRNRQRRGHVLVFFAFILVAVMALAALVVDLGIARLTQRQMQAAADTAATEALRHRDALPPELQGDSPTNPRLASVEATCGPRPPLPVDLTSPAWVEWLDCARRELAQQMLDRTFADGDSSNPGGAVQQGAGPVLEFTGGFALDPDVTGAVASELLTIPDRHTYQPQLDPNLANDSSVPDMAAGVFGLNADYPSEETHEEDGAYERRDFVAGARPDNAFLVRLRRTPDNAVSGGGPVPYLFGRGNLLDMDRSARGISVRGTSIAGAGMIVADDSTSYQVGRAKCAGPALIDRTTSPPVLIAGLSPFSLEAAYWSDASWGSAKQQDDLEVDRNTGQLLQNTPGGIRNVGNVAGAAASDLLRLGQTIVDGTGDASLSQIVPENRLFHIYVPIYDVVGGNAKILVGFGYAEWSYDSAAGRLHLQRPLDLSTQTMAERIGNGNVSGILPRGGTPWSLAAGDVPELFQRHHSLAAPLLAPVRVR